MSFPSRDIREATGVKAKALVTELQSQGVVFETGADLEVGVYGSCSDQTKHRYVHLIELNQSGKLEAQE